MAEYELVYILAPTVPDEDLEARTNRVNQLITGAGAEVIRVSPWGRRRLAYQIERHREGLYVTHDFRGPTSAVAPIERGILLADDILRHVVIRKPEPKAPRPPRRLKRQPQTQAQPQSQPQPAAQPAGAGTPPA